MRATRQEIMKLFKLWDSAGKMRLRLASASEAAYRCGLFAVAKDAHRLRQILNPTSENDRCHSFNDETARLGHSTCLTAGCVKPGRGLVISGDDLEDMYHCFLISEAASDRNTIAFVFRCGRLHWVRVL